MSSHHGESVSIWFQNAAMPERIALKEDFKTDVCIIGGGIAGLTTAYLLQKEGKRVCILEASDLASGQSGRTTAHFTHALDDRFYLIEKYHGEEGLRLAIESHSEAIRKVEEIVRKEHIDCDLKRVSGYLFAEGDKRDGILEREFEAAHRGGLIDVTISTTSPFANIQTGPCLHFPRQVKLHPIKYLKALTEIILRDGGQIFTNTPVVEVHGGENAFVKTKDDYRIFCENIVVATNTPINDMVAIHTKQAPYRTYVLGFKIPKNSYPDILLWDTLDPYHYSRLYERENFDVLIVGGEDHKTGQNDEPKNCYLRLEAWARKKFPLIQETLYQWSGQVMEPVDGLAYLGHNPMDEKNVYIITGDSGNGMTHCTVGAMLITDQIMGRENEWEKLYTPSRISLSATKNYVQENANVALQYADWINTSFKADLDQLPEDEGVVFRDGGKIVAAYKNINGEMEYMSAVCPHLAGIVAWNGAEKSWDCPCHGSRFDCHGKVIEGPAISDLKHAEHHRPEKERIFEKNLQGRFDKNAVE
ncbi:FAD-dependent oxidoreductase [Bacteriovorax stolpii]|uniref:FAD-dependent oxidoreductase n=1 Tax=Bacteriovorax stolpii TaxID=960 RepID=A0A2K9NVN1_BACTC|nr:FAD-dependent oxidoreductase [Bacteriovorax stolpii]AUN98824.1 FAD-dependent oxidoreductase [Bacteriovorax stolpii]QDK41181.1 FAD-dependent oxidoreductase [Bacteriovorax stolpii]TDP55657.1 glycine/D-amino acid oxidase-like deaminating enzyme [Bacteriovorax stolpii]